MATNGLGGYACGTLSGANTRRYHGFLMASFRPPVERTLLVSKVDITIEYLAREYPLFTNEFADNTVTPAGFIHLESFALADGVPVWRYALADALLEQRIFMGRDVNTSYLRLEVLRATAPVKVMLKPLVTYRDYHSHGRGVRPFKAHRGTDRCTIEAFPGARPYTLALQGGTYEAADLWYWSFLHREELARGMDAIEDLWGPGSFTVEMSAGDVRHFTATAEASEPVAGDDVLKALVHKSQRLLSALPKSAPPWVRSLAIASDQFIVRRDANVAAHADAKKSSSSVIAGYPWFTDWGRDTMIALPGLTLALGRFDTAASILRTFARVVDRGMLPNRFPDAGEHLEYNTADATLWMFQTVSDYLDAERDPDMLREIFPVLADIIHAHVEGTRYGIGVDPADGLLHAGQAGVQLTWMDAKNGDHVFTPRVGKPVEINALWLNALEVAARLAARLRSDVETRFCQDQLQRAGSSFARFWNGAKRCLYDVIDVDGGSACDASIRPNQLFAVSLPYSVLSAEQMRDVVDVCGRELLTSYGLRSLSTDDPAYQGRYVGDSWQRDAAYHQGTVWSWLLGPYARAHFRVHGDPARAKSFLAPMAQHLDAACIGSVSEIFDGAAPHTARGCFAQAWSVAEILRTWLYLDGQSLKSRGG